MSDRQPSVHHPAIVPQSARDQSECQHAPGRIEGPASVPRVWLPSTTRQQRDGDARDPPTKFIFAGAGRRISQSPWQLAAFFSAHDWTNLIAPL